VSIHDVSGRQVLELWRGKGTEAHITWDGRDAKGVHVPAGTYFVRIEDQNQVRALELVRLP
jgi:flagellar hook assembly protein FlgD